MKLITRFCLLLVVIGLLLVPASMSQPRPVSADVTSLTVYNTGAANDMCLFKNGGSGAWGEFGSVSGAGWNTTTYTRLGTGYRFTGVSVPVGSRIVSSKLSFRASSNYGVTVVNTRINAERTSNASTFSTVADFQTRRGLDAGGASDWNIFHNRQVTWDGVESWTSGVWYDSPDLSSLIQSVVDQRDWTGVSGGNTMVFYRDDFEDRSSHSTTCCRNSMGAESIYPVSLTINYEPDDRGTVVCIGDSLTTGSPLRGGFTDRLNVDFTVEDWSVLDRGIGGQFSSEVLARFDGDAIDPGPELIVLWVGINDVRRGDSVASIEYNLSLMYSMADNASIPLIAVNITPWKDYGGWSAEKQDVQDTVNIWIATKPYNIIAAIDAWTLVEDAVNPDTVEGIYDSGDHLHLTDVGYALIADEVYSYSPYTTTPVLRSVSVSLVSLNGCRISGSLTSLGGSSCNVSWCYGSTDGGGEISNWDNVTLFETPTQPMEEVDDFTMDVLTLVPACHYYWRVNAWNGSVAAWTGTQQFDTLVGSVTSGPAGADGAAGAQGATGAPGAIDWESLWEGNDMYLLMLCLGSVVMLVVGRGSKGGLWCLSSCVCSIGVILVSSSEGFQWIQIAAAVLLGLGILSLVQSATRGRV